MTVSSNRIARLAGLAATMLVAAACQPAEPAPLTDLERAAIADTLGAIAARQDTLNSTEECLGVLDIFTGDEPMVVSGGKVFRSRADLEALCRRSGSGITRTTMEITTSDAHVLSRDVAYLVRQGNLVYYMGDDQPMKLYHVSSIVFRRTSRRVEADALSRVDPAARRRLTIGRRIRLPARCRSLPNTGAPDDTELE